MELFINFSYYKTNNLHIRLIYNLSYSRFSYTFRAVDRHPEGATPIF